MKHRIPSIFLLSAVLIWSSTCFFPITTYAAELVPANLFNIGDSIGEAEAANGVIRTWHHDKVWSTGYDKVDEVNSFNERFAATCPTVFEANSDTRDPVFNQAITGSDMSDFADQAQSVVDAAAATTENSAGMITVYLGNNDACADTISEMTSAADFEANYRAGLDILAGAEETGNARIHISAIPSLYWLWESLRNDTQCHIVWQFVPCHNLLDNPVNDCGTGDSYLDPDTIHTDDGPNCVRRKQFHAMIRDVYNPILHDVLQEYVDDQRLPFGYFSNVFGFRFQAEDINKGDCFHPSITGQALLADREWRASPWSEGLQCSESKQAKALPWLYFLLQ